MEEDSKITPEITERTPSEEITAPVPEKNKTNKKPFLILISAFLLGAIILIIFIVFLFSSNKNKNVETGTNIKLEPYQVISSKNEVIKPEVKKMAQEIVNYIKSQKRSDGYYNYVAHYEKVCTNTENPEKCIFGKDNMYQTTNAWSALGLYAGSKIIGDKSLLTDAKTDLLKLDEYCNNDRVECNRVLVQPSLIFQNTNDPVIKEFLNKQINSLINSKVSPNPMLTAIEARSAGIMSGIFNNSDLRKFEKTRLDESSSSLQKITQNLYISSPVQFRSGSCWVALSAIENESLTTKNYTSIALFLDNGKIEENFSQIYAPLDIQPCIESYLLIYNQTNDINYLNKAKRLMTLFINNFYDGKSKPVLYGEGGTRFTNSNKDATSEKIVTLTDSSYTLYLLSLFYDYEN